MEVRVVINTNRNQDVVQEVENHEIQLEAHEANLEQSKENISRNTKEISYLNNMAKVFLSYIYYNKIHFREVGRSEILGGTAVLL